MKFINQSLSAALIVIIAAIGLSGCKSSQKQTSSKAPARAAQQAPASSDVFTRMTEAYNAWSDVTVPVKVSVTKPKKISASGTLVMSYGKAMSLTMKMLFIEVASVYADADSVLVVSKPVGAYYSESIAKFTASAGLTLADLQSLMLGQAFAPGAGTATPSSGKLFTTEPVNLGVDGYYAVNITPKKLPSGVDWHFCAIGQDGAATAAPQLFSLNVSAGANTVECTYASAEVSPAGPIASRMQVEGTVKKHDIDLEVSATTSRASWNTGATPSRPSVPKGAKRMTTDQVLKMLNSL